MHATQLLSPHIRRRSGCLDTHRYDEQIQYDEEQSTRSFAPLAPAALWGLVMLAAIGAAGAAVWRGEPASGQRLVTADAEAPLRRDLARLGSERDALALRVAALERGFGDMKLARRATEPESTGSIQRPGDRPAAGYGLSLGIEPSLDAAKRRWTTLAARFPGQLAKLTPLARKEAGKTPLFELVAGPYPGRPDAEAACGTLADQGLACDTTDYAGDPIGR